MDWSALPCLGPSDVVCSCPPWSVLLWSGLKWFGLPYFSFSARLVCSVLNLFTAVLCCVLTCSTPFWWPTFFSSIKEDSSVALIWSPLVFACLFFSCFLSRGLLSSGLVYSGLFCFSLGSTLVWFPLVCLDSVFSGVFLVRLSLPWSAWLGFWSTLLSLALLWSGLVWRGPFYSCLV